MSTHQTANPFDPEQFRVTDTLGITGDGIKKELTRIRVGKPKKSSFFRVHPNESYRIPVSVIEDLSGGMKEEYLVMPHMALQYAEETTPKLLVLCVDKMGIPFLWLAPRVDATSPMRANLWNETALKGLDLALTKWVRLSANMHEGCYNVHTAGEEPDPVWPELTMAQLMELGFGEERVIRSDQHPLIRQLLGRD